MNRKIIGEAIYIRVSDRKSILLATKRENVSTRSRSRKSAVFLMESALTSHGSSKLNKKPSDVRGVSDYHSSSSQKFVACWSILTLCIYTVGSRSLNLSFAKTTSRHGPSSGATAFPTMGTFEKLRGLLQFFSSLDCQLYNRFLELSVEAQGLVTIHVNILSMHKQWQGRTLFLPPLASSRLFF
jgi:hypothetical protein